MFKKIISVITLIALVFTCNGCSTKKKGPDSVTGMYLSQSNRVGNCTDTTDERYKALEPFLNAAKTFAVIPGIKEYFIPQGIEQNPNNGHIYISGYFLDAEVNPFSNDENPCAIVVLDTDGKLIAEFVLSYPDGKAFEGFAGGLAVSEDTLFIPAPNQKESDGSTGFYIASVSLSKLDKTGHNSLAVDQLYPVPIPPANLNFSANTLWISNYYVHGDKDFSPPEEMGTVYASSDKQTFGSYLLGYTLTAKSSESAPATDFFMKPDTDKVYALPDHIQGITVLDNGSIWLCQAAGNQSNTALTCMDPTKATQTPIQIQGETYSCKVLEKKLCQAKSHVLMPRGAGITVSKTGNQELLYVLFDSASQIYDGGLSTNYAIFRTDYIWTVNIKP